MDEEQFRQLVETHLSERNDLLRTQNQILARLAEAIEGIATHGLPGGN